MCGRAYQTYTEDELFERFQWERLKRKPLGIKPNYNLSPTQTSPVVIIKDGKREIELFKWGLVPFWAKDTKIGYKMINSRAETITEKPSFRKAFEMRRCIIPLSGFYEWKREEKSKRPFAIYHKDKSIMGVGGIWETWKDPKGELFHTFSMITTRPNSLMREMHDRMPVLIPKEDEDEWLDPTNSDVEGLKRMFKPISSSKLIAYEISPLVNSPKNNKPEVLEPRR